MLFLLFGEFILFFSYPFQHTSFTWIALPTPFEVNLSATFLGYFPSPCSFVSCSPRIVFFLPSFLPLSLSLSRFLFLFLSFIVEFVGSYFPDQGLILGPWQSPNHWSARELPVLFHILISVWVHSLVEGDYWMSVSLCG